MREQSDLDIEAAKKEMIAMSLGLINGGVDSLHVIYALIETAYHINSEEADLVSNEAIVANSMHVINAPDPSEFH